MTGGKTSLKERLCISLLGVSLWIAVIALGLAIGLDLWVKKPASMPSDDISLDISQQTQWMVGLWKACLVPADDEVVVYTLEAHNCTSVADLDQLRKQSAVGGWSLQLQIVSLVFILTAAVMVVIAHMFFICGYIPRAKCKTCGLGGLPSVLITSGVCQISTLVTVYFMCNKMGVYGPSYYLTVASLVPTWATAVATLIITCRVS